MKAHCGTKELRIPGIVFSPIAFWQSTNIPGRMTGTSNRNCNFIVGICVQLETKHEEKKKRGGTITMSD